MEQSQKVGNDNYNEIIRSLVSNYMQMLDLVDYPLEQVERHWGQNNFDCRASQIHLLV